ncbi:cilia- and flagella-associated protein 73 [Ammospiza caudacuta]|uniref:cilia- and flagella-associated protein 73 n=1 Tax=Ammospiza caudacuta TaxID=2857398 RepID=UPI00273A2E2B|nr:cilia- and flagella-associated protein 73 [Ammospiza caudacuta]
MEPELEERVREALRDKLRLLPAELHAARGRTGTARGPATLPPSTRVLLKRREVAEAERELQNERQVRALRPGRCSRPPVIPQEFQQRMQRLAQRRQQLARRREQHRDAVLRFESFLKAAAARRERELRRADEQRARAAAERAESARLRRELERLRRHRERLARRLRSLRPFGDYLRDVLAAMGQFQDVPAMLVHLGVLAEVRAALAREAEAGQEQLAQGRAQLQRYRQESSTQLLGTWNELARLHTRLEAAQQDVHQWESCWTHIQSTATQKTLLLGQIKLAVLNLFQQTTAQLRILTDRAQEDTKAQLDTVLLCMKALSDICATGTHPQQHRSVRLLQGHK